MAYRQKRNWFYDEEIQVHLNTLTIPFSYKVADVGTFTYNMGKGIRLDSKTREQRKDFLSGIEAYDHVLYRIYIAFIINFE